MNLRVAIASDHAAFDMKTVLAEWLRGEGHAVEDLGPHGTDAVDYPDYGYMLATTVAAGDADFGVALCGSGIGISIAANRHPAIRCALVSEALSARFARTHNDANIIAMGARMIGIEAAKDCLATFLATPFLGGRHGGRVTKLSQPRFEKEPA